MTKPLPTGSIKDNPDPVSLEDKKGHLYIRYRVRL